MNYKDQGPLPTHFSGRQKTAAQLQADAQSILHGTVFHDDVARAERMGKIASRVSIPFLAKKAAEEEAGEERAKSKRKRHEDTEAAAPSVSPETAAALQLSEARADQAEQDEKAKADLALLQALSGDEGVGKTAALTDDQAMQFLLKDPEGQALAKQAEDLGREQARLDARNEGIEKDAVSTSAMAQGVRGAIKSKALQHALIGGGITGGAEALVDPDASVGRVLAATAAGAGGAGTVSHLATSGARAGAEAGMRSASLFGRDAAEAMNKLPNEVMTNLHGLEEKTPEFLKHVQAGLNKGELRFDTGHLGHLQNQSDLHRTLAKFAPGETAKIHTAAAEHLDRVAEYVKAGQRDVTSGISSFKITDPTHLQDIRQGLKDNPLWALHKEGSIASEAIGAAERGATKGRMLASLLAAGAGGTAGALSDEDHRVRNALIGAGTAAPLAYGAHALAGRGALKDLRATSGMLSRYGGDDVASTVKKLTGEQLREHLPKELESAKRFIDRPFGESGFELTHEDVPHIRNIESMKLVGGGEHPAVAKMKALLGASDTPVESLSLGMKAKIHDAAVVKALKEHLRDITGASSHGGGGKSLGGMLGGGASAEGGSALTRGPLGLAARHPVMTSMAAVPTGAALGGLMTGGVHNKEDAHRDVRNMAIGGGTGLGAAVLPALLASV